MTDTHVVSALKKKRAELAGQIDTLQDQLSEALAAVDHIDHSLRLFDPDVDLDAIKPKPLPPRHHAYKGQVTRRILGMLRVEGPMSTKAIAVRLMTERDLKVHDRALQKLMRERIGAALRTLRDRETVTSEEGPDGLLVWALAG